MEIDRLKHILRQTLLVDASRQENSAEHSWHLAIMAIVLAEYAPAGTDMSRAIQMLLIHDLVEIDAGDTFCYDVQGNLDKADREQRAADRIFGLLPPDLEAELRLLWEEFEARETATAQFAAALDRIQPLLHNYKTAGGTWKKHGVSIDQVWKRMEPVKQGTPDLWEWVEAIVAESVAAGYIRLPLRETAEQAAQQATL
nr:HD domain-containing protein [Leptolyngbya sp. FACHB-711]